VAILASVALRSYVVEVFRVPTGSMLPTLQINDRIVVDKLPGLAHSIHRGDIIVFHKVRADTDSSTPILVKRVIGLPGETISSKGDTVYINGHSIAEPWLPALKGGCVQSAFNISKTHIPANHYFVMGDCRGNSYDSRFWGTVPVSHVIGRVFVVVWQHNHPWFHWF
ncbi:MAG: signal peptidase I, partial [Acidimicrobiales bacterium]